MCIFIIIGLIIILILVKIKNKTKQMHRKKMRQLAEKMLDKQIKILSQGNYNCITFELEISKFIRDCLLYNLEEGVYAQWDVNKAHIWLREAFKDEFEVFIESDY